MPTSAPTTPGPSRPVGPAKLRQAARVTRAGVARYSRAIVDSIRERAEPVPAVTPRVDLSGFESLRTGAVGIGHATVLLNIAGMIVLTDPVFSHRIGMRIAGVTLGLSRLLPPAVDVEHLPEIDLVLLSHAHFDHLDRPSLRRLAQGPARKAVVITARGTRQLIPRSFHRVIELPWDECIRLRGARVHALRPEHWGARAAIDRHRRFNSYVIENAGKRVLFAGDTAATHAFDKVGSTNLSIFGIGAYDPWLAHHATPEQVWSMFTRQTLGHRRGRLLPMHHSTFPLGHEPLSEPLQRLTKAAGKHAHKLVAPSPGEIWDGSL